MKNTTLPWTFSSFCTCYSTTERADITHSQHYSAKILCTKPSIFLVCLFNPCFRQHKNCSKKGEFRV